jgi:hypothetical protein
VVAEHETPREYGARSRGQLKGRSAETTPEDRAKIRSLWIMAVTVVEQLCAGARSDRSLMFGAATKLASLLSRLWELRTHRDDNWVGILDQVQSSLKSLAATEIETATAEQCELFLELVKSHLSPATKSIEDLTEATRLVLALGGTPYPGLGPLARS